MSGIEAVFFDCDGTLVDSEVICSRAYVAMFQEFGITLDLEEVFKRFKGVKLYEIIDIINEEHGVDLAKADLEPVYRAEVARLFDAELEVIAGANTLLDAMTVPICVVSDGPVSKMQHSLGKLNMLHHFPEKLFSGYDIQRWKPDPALMFHAAKAMNVNVENCILVDDSSAGAQSGIDAGMEVFYFCADPHNKPIRSSKSDDLYRSGATASVVEGARVGYYSLSLPSPGPLPQGEGENRMILSLWERVRVRQKSLFRIFARQQLVQLVAAHVSEILPLHEVEDVFANVLAAVTDTLD